MSTRKQQRYCACTEVNLSETLSAAVLRLVELEGITFTLLLVLLVLLFYIPVMLKLVSFTTSPASLILRGLQKAEAKEANSKERSQEVQVLHVLVLQQRTERLLLPLQQQQQQPQQEQQQRAPSLMQDWEIQNAGELLQQQLQLGPTRHRCVKIHEL
ncbi:unnamed protein product [Rangifer tarandus platyrhynchus]|uniref:Uncharacterized protein n=1 Tax=Rangifer tarandus platyrhynchus TaxID=3082113 RepID=A0ABN8XKU1_RANTA|nr:unnamed protein product [Rangifer tarandus platyrhynchus]